ncbi:MAG: isoamylase early set domain-containing protein [Gemmatimonadales bacterium]
MTERDRFDRAIELLKEPVHLDRSFDRRVMAELASAPRPKMWVRPVWAGLGWMVRSRTVRVSPLGGLAIAAGLTALLLIGRAGLQPSEPPTTTAASDGTIVQFVVVHPAASRVSLVGDFNDWSDQAMPMERESDNGLWSITVPLQPGRYRYAFLVDGMTWISDPSAPPALDDDFGRPGSVVTIGGL